MDHAKKTQEKKVDKAVDMTFPASDPPASGKATGTEPAKRPADRKAPIITKEEIEQARRGARPQAEVGMPANRSPPQLALINASWAPRRRWLGAPR